MALRPTRPQSRTNQLADRKSAAASAQGDVFLREVDDALREDQVFTALQRYGKPVGALVVAGLVGLAGWLWYDNHRAGVAAEQGEKFTIALDQVEQGRIQTGADTMAPLVKDGSAGYRAAAQLMQAGIAQQQNKPDQAVKLFAAVAGDASLPQAYRDLATVREIATNFDKMPVDKVVERLKPLAMPGNPWFGSAGEMLAVAYMKQGRNDLAGALFGSIAKDKTMPESLRQRTRQMAGVLGVDAVEDPSITFRPGGSAAGAQAPSANGQAAAQ